MTQRSDIEAIKSLKYKYLRCLDTKRWKELGECFTEDATSSYDGGKYAFRGKDEIMGFLEQALGRPCVITLHQVHHPEIEFSSDTEAAGRWYLEDRVIDTEAHTEIRGAAFYRDEYVKIRGEWKLKFTGYERTFEEIWDRRELPSLRITKSMFEAPEAKES